MYLAPKESLLELLIGRQLHYERDGEPVILVIFFCL